MQGRIKFILAAAAVLLCVSAPAKYTDDFILGNFSYLRATSNFLPRVDSLAARMREAGFNATVCEILDGSSPAQIKQLLNSFDKQGIDAILTDKAWLEGRSNPQYGTEGLSMGNYWRFEAEYDSSSTLNRNADRFFYIHSGRTGKAVSLKAASGGWLRVLSDGQKGFALNRMEFRWPSAASPVGVRYDIGPEFRFVQRAYGSGSKDDFAANPCANDTLFITLAFNCRKIPSEPAAPLFSVSFEGNPDESASRVQPVSHIFSLTGKKQETSVLTVQGYNSLPIVKKDSWGQKCWPHRELTLCIPIKDLYDTGLIDPTKGWRYSLLSLNPRLFWEGRGSLELDYLEFEDTMHRGLRFNEALRDSVRARVKTLSEAYNNISYLFLTDEPTPGQFSAYNLIEHGLLDDLDKLAPSVKGLMSCSWLYRRNVLKENGDYFNLISLFDDTAKPEILMFDIYPLFGSMRWNKPEVSRGVQKTLDTDLLQYYKKYKTLCEKRGTQFIPATQTYGIWVYGEERWGTLRPPRYMQKCLQLLPLCYGASGILSFKLYDVVTDPLVTKQAKQDFSPINVRESGGKVDLDVNGNWEGIKEANSKILAYAKQLKQLKWLDADAALTSGYRNPKMLASAGLDSLYVRPQSLTENGIDLYDGYVQCGLFNQKNGAPALMLVNRRTEYILPITGLATEASDELLKVPNSELDKVCLPAAPQTVRIVPNADILKKLGKFPGLWDSYDKILYQYDGTGFDVPIGPGDGKLLEFVATLPNLLESSYKLNGKSVLGEEILLREGARVTLGSASDTLVLRDITVADGASLTAKGKVTFADHVRIKVRNGGKVNLKGADCVWGEGTKLVRQ